MSSCKGYVWILMVWMVGWWTQITVKVNKSILVARHLAKKCKIIVMSCATSFSLLLLRWRENEEKENKKHFFLLLSLIEENRKKKKRKYCNCYEILFEFEFGYLYHYLDSVKIWVDRIYYLILSCISYPLAINSPLHASYMTTLWEYQ